MKNSILAICVLCCSLVQAEKPAFKMKVTLQSSLLPATYRIKVKLGLAYKVIDLQKIKEEKRRTPIDSDVLIGEKSPNEYDFEVTYASGKPVFSKGQVLEFVLPGGMSDAPKGLFSMLSFPTEYEIYDGPRLISQSNPQFGMQVETARTKPVCFKIHQDELGKASELRVRVGLSECGLDFSKQLKSTR